MTAFDDTTATTDGLDGDRLPRQARTGFAKDTEVKRVSAGRFTADLADRWASLHQLHGGYVASVAARAVRATLADRGDPPLRAATFGFLAGGRPGPVDIEVVVERAGRSLVFTSVHVRQDGEPILIGQAANSPRWTGVDYSDLPPPRGPDPGDVPVFTSDGLVRHFGNADVRLDPSFVPFSSAASSSVGGWVRPLADERVDSTWLVMLGDIFPPAVFHRTTGPVPAFTIHYGVQLHVSDPAAHVPAGSYVYAHMHAPHAAEGFAVEDGVVWAPDGTVLATCRQTRLAGNW